MKRITIYLLIFILGVSAFYWYDLRPRLIKQKCIDISANYFFEKAEKRVEDKNYTELVDVATFLFKTCVYKKGLSIK